MISLQSLARAVGYSLARKRAAERAELELDGSRAAARKARDEQLEQERLDFLAAQLVRRTA